MRRFLPLVGLMACWIPAQAEEQAPVIPRIDAEPLPGANGPVTVSEWLHQMKLGAYLNSISSDNADASRDPSIGGGSESVAYQVSFDGKLDWLYGKQRVEQSLLLRYGRIRAEHEDFEESTDLIDYDGAYKYLFKNPHYFYGGWGGDSVFTGPEPYNEAFDPVIAKVSAGYGQFYEGFQQLSSKFDARIGVRAQRHFGPRLDNNEDDVEVGPEFLARYERQPTNALSYFAQYEAFGEFEDMAHIQHLVTAGLDLLLAPYLTLRLAGRGYYESEPDDAPAGAPGYDEFSYRQETLLGFTFVY
jgi:hypothetical protein